jgi:hypothetical protein
VSDQINAIKMLDKFKNVRVSEERKEQVIEPAEG